MAKQKELGPVISKYLKDNEMTVQELSSIIGASPSSIYNWIAGKPMLKVYYNALLSVLREYL